MEFLRSLSSLPPGTVRVEQTYTGDRPALRFATEILLGPTTAARFNIACPSRDTHGGSEQSEQMRPFGFDFNVHDIGRGHRRNVRAPGWTTEDGIEEILQSASGNNIPRHDYSIIPVPEYNGGVYGVDEYAHGYNPLATQIEHDAGIRQRPDNVQFPQWMSPDDVEDVLRDAFGNNIPQQGDIVIHYPDRNRDEFEVRYFPHGQEPNATARRVQDFPVIPPDTRPVPASNSAIARMPTKQITSEESGHTCGICMEGKYTGDTVTVLPCSHWFCKECVETWLRQNRICPTCRAPVEENRGRENENHHRAQERTGRGHVAGTATRNRSGTLYDDDLVLLRDGVNQIRRPPNVAGTTLREDSRSGSRPETADAGPRICNPRLEADRRQS